MLVVLIFLPAQRMHHSNLNPIRLPPVPMIVKPPNDQPMLFDERALFLPHRVVLVHPFRLVVVMIEECRLMRDDQVLPVCRRPFQHVQRRHHRHRNSRNRRIRIPRFECIHGLAHPRDANVFLNRGHYLARCRPLLLRHCARAAECSAKESHAQRRAQESRRYSAFSLPSWPHDSLLSANLRALCVSALSFLLFSRVLRIFAGARSVTWAILPRTSERAPAPFALTHAPIGASIALPLASARSLSSPSIPPRDTCDPPRRKSTAEFSFLSRFLSAKIFACVSTDSVRYTAGPATKAPSTLKKTGILSAWSNLRALKHRRAPRGLFPSFRMGCVPVLLPPHQFRRREPTLRAPAFPARDKPAAATGSPSPEFPAAPVPDSPDTRASAARPAG